MVNASPPLHRRRFLQALAGAALGATARPNIVFILADDLGYGDLSCYNAQSKIPTPHLDALARGGLRFTNAHTPSAVCTPSRYGLLTGRYAWRTRLTQGVLDGFDPPLIEKNRMTVASMLRQQGYATACVGKWHLGMQWTRQDGTPVPFRPSFEGGFRDGRDVDYTKPISGGPTSTGFDYYFGISASLDMSPYCFMENDRTVGLPGVRSERDVSLFMNQVAGVKTGGFDLHTVLPECGRKARAFLEKQTAAKPFFLYMPLSAPHLPIVPNREFEGRSKAGLYGDLVVEMDAVAGSVLDTLKSKGLDRNTLVFFSSDNGGLWHWWDFVEADDVAHGRITPRGQYVKDHGHQGNGILRGTKADIWDGGHRVPLIAAWPGHIPAGRVSDKLVCLIDFMATSAEVCGVPLPQDAAEDSFSMLPVLLRPEDAKPVRRDIIYHSSRGEFSIQEGDWKLILTRGSGGFSSPVRLEPKQGEARGQLFNMSKDPQETRNVYLEHPDVVARLAGLLQKYRQAGRTRPL
jgi:arylsulfatase A-like enzyme